MAEAVDHQTDSRSSTAEPLVAGVRFRDTGKVYHFDASGHTDLERGDFALVETSHGLQLGEVLSVRPAHEGEVEALKPIRRRATGRDLALRQRRQEKAEDALQAARDLAKELEIPVKIAAADYTYDGRKLTILYVSEDGEKGLNKLRDQLRRQLGGPVTLRRVGPRDHARFLHGYGACGEMRCCSRFLCDFQSVSMKMAKSQGVSLNPSEITGMCGRLRCCLVYEHEQYAEACKSLPKIKKRVRTPHGEGRVVGLLPLKGVVVVQIEDRRVEVPAEEVERIK